MIDIARSEPGFRRELFRETARTMGIHEAIIEKDFWVCLVLHLLFTSETWKDKILFKGGTSLSKVYSLIDRFSEDIDLILDWRELGYSINEPWKPESNNQKDRFVKDTTPKATDYLRSIFIPDFKRELDERLGPITTMEMSNDSIKLLYPKAFDNPAILPYVILEIGPLAEWTPHQRGTISPYISRYFPAPFSIASAIVQVVTAERSFWEKATILHQEFHRPNEKSSPSRYSRHYYDTYKIGQSSVFASALHKPELLEQVVKFKERFYRVPWSSLTDAKRGSFRLAPPVHRVEELRRDYDKMKPMFFSAEPRFDDIVQRLSEMEKEINTKACL